ncbi:MAG: DUF262 domain-containing protein [Colwellia sp.]
MTTSREEKQEAIEVQIKKSMQSYDYDTLEYPISVLVDQYKQSLDKNFLEEDVNTGNVIYIPDYQREFIWSDERKSKFIESILIGVPIPYFFLADISGNMEVVDGSQRLRTLHQFISGELKLIELKNLTLLNGHCFSDLTPVRQRRFLSKGIKSIYLSERTTPEARYDLFERINTGSDELKAAEIRKGAFAGPLGDFINKCAKNPLFMKLCPLGKKIGLRAEGAERVLRFFAYSENDPITEYKGRVAPFLDAYMERVSQDFDELIQESMLKKFEAMLNFVNDNFPYGFKKVPTANSTPRVRFEAIAVGVANALKENSKLTVDNVIWIESDDFYNVTRSDAANNKANLFGRINFVKNKLQGV